MGNIGGGEVLVILLVALLVLGPDKLPGAARQVGRVMGEIRKVTGGFQQELRRAIDEAANTEPTPAAQLPDVSPPAEVPAAETPPAETPPVEVPAAETPDDAAPGADEPAAG